MLPVAVDSEATSSKERGVSTRSVPSREHGEKRREQGMKREPVKVSVKREEDCLVATTVWRRGTEKRKEGRDSRDVTVQS